MKNKTEIETTHLFLQLSATLTGYSTADLSGTGMSDAYYNEVRDIVGGRIFGRLLLTWSEIQDSGPGEESEQEISMPVLKELRKRILDNPLLGPIARNIITLWYLGNWNQLPRAWRQLYGAQARDQSRVVSAMAFREGLVWDAIGAHPPTAKPPGFGTWASPPKDAELLD